MAKVTPITTSMAAGEISPLMYGRVDTEGYAAGVASMRNMYADSRGPAINRHGLKQIQELAGEDGRVWGYRATDSIPFAIVAREVNIDVVSISESIPATVGLYAAVAPFNAAALWAGPELQEVQIIPAPGTNTIYFIHELHQPHKLVYDPGPKTWTFGPVTFTSAPASWTGANWPSVGAFYQGRLWLGSTPAEPETFWGSKSGLPEDFTLGSLDDEAIEFTLEQAGRIEWMASARNMIVGTIGAEYIVSSEGAVITPTDVFAEFQSVYGSKSVKAIPVGDKVFYISPDGRKVRGVQYEWTADALLSQDLTFISEHITEGSIKQFAWVQNPNNLLWCVLENGDACCMTYERSNNVFGWHSHDTQGDFIDVGNVDALGTSYAIFLTKRQDATLFLEIMSDYTQLDSHITITNDPATDVITGLDHLEGYEVQILADGAVHPNRTVVSGSITLQLEAEEVIVGLQFIPSVVTLTPEVGNKLYSSQPAIKAYNKIYVNCRDSNAPLINGIRPPDRTPGTPMDTGEPAITTIYTVNPFGNSKSISISVSQDLPVPLTILSIYAEMAVNLL